MRAIVTALCCILFLALIEGQPFPNLRRAPRKRPDRGPPTNPRPTSQPSISQIERANLARQSAQKKIERKRTQQAQNERTIAQQAGREAPSIIRQTSSSLATGLFTPTVLHNGVIFPIINGRVTIGQYTYLICGNLLGRADENICCDGFLYSLQNGQIECCGDAFIYTDEICCEGNIFPKFFRNIELACCGSEFLLVSTEICCDGVITLGSSCGSACPPGFVCCNGNQVQSSTGLGCCNNEFFSTSFQKCCNEQQVKLIGESCSTTGCVETTTQFCCGGNLFPKGSIIECCNDNIFTTQFQKCCSSGEIKLIDEPCTGCIPVSGVSFCCGGESFPLNIGIGCCNDVSYGTNGFTCCANTVISTAIACCIENAIIPIDQCQ